MFVHNVFFWLTPAAGEAERDQLLNDCRELLSQIPSVRKLHAGVPANTPGSVVDNSYAVGLTVVFDGLEGHDSYHAHSLHDEFLARNKAVMERVVVYDFVED